MKYKSTNGKDSERIIWPLGLFFWGKVWTLAAWCEIRQEFRNFRLDRIVSHAVLTEAYPDEPGRTLDDMIAYEQQRECDSQ